MVSNTQRCILIDNRKEVLFLQETDMFPFVKSWLEDNGYTVYTEVVSTLAGGRADVVGVAGPAVAIVEMKKTMTLELLSQALRWKLFSNYVYIAVACTAKRRVSHHVARLLNKEGIGLLEICFPDKSSQFNSKPYIVATARAKFNRRIDDHIRKSLTHMHQELPGGHAGGGYITTYRKTIRNVQDYLQCMAKDEWASLDDILNYCETHWSSPKPSLSHALRTYELDWCESKKIGRKTFFRSKT
ncbi:hypothetical protein D3C71_1241050 [compost metagenome]